MSAAPGLTYEHPDAEAGPGPGAQLHHEIHVDEDAEEREERQARHLGRRCQVSGVGGWAPALIVLQGRGSPSTANQEVSSRRGPGTQPPTEHGTAQLFLLQQPQIPGRPWLRLL